MLAYRNVSVESTSKTYFYDATYTSITLHVTTTFNAAGKIDAFDFWR